MENEMNDIRMMLKKIMSNQIVIYREIEKISEKLKNSSSSKGYDSVIKDLEKKATEIERLL